MAGVGSSFEVLTDDLYPFRAVVGRRASRADVGVLYEVCLLGTQGCDDNGRPCLSFLGILPSRLL